MSIHAGHRQRNKDRFKASGLESFCEHEVLELLLYYCIPRKDTNQIAHNLIKRFGSFVQVMEAPARELEKVEGVGENAAMFLNLIRESYRYFHVSAAKQTRYLHKVEDYGEYLRSFFLGMRNEVVYLLCMDAQAGVIDCVKIAEGGVNSANISIRKIADIALGTNASTVVLAHNHPGGLAVPSPEDVLVTKRIARTLANMDVYLTDHIVVAGADFVSMYQSGMYDYTALED